MADLDLDELVRLADAATPGPWEWWTSNSCLRLSAANGRDGGVLYASNIRSEYATVVVSDADRRFISEARTAIPALIARIRELEQDAARYRAIRAYSDVGMGLRVFDSRGALNPDALDEEADALIAAMAASAKGGKNA